MSLLDEIRKLITGERTQGEMSEAYLGKPEYYGTSRNTIDDLVTPNSVRNFPLHMNRLINQNPTSPNYVAPTQESLGLLRGMEDNLNAMSDTQRMMEQNYDLDPNTPYSTNAQGQGTPYNPIRNRQEDVINPANDFTLYADGLNARVDSGYTKDVEKDSMEQTILDRAKEKAEEKKLTEGSSNFVSYGQNMPVSDTKPTLSQADIDKLTANYTREGQPYTRDNTDVSFLDKVGDFVGNKERMLKLALAFNSMRLEPDQGLATALNDRLKTLSKQGKAQSVATYLTNKGRPDLADLVLKNPELTTQALQEVRQSNKFKILTGAQLEKEYGIKGLPSKASFKYNTMSGEVSGIGQGNTIINTVKPETGYRLVYDEEGRVTHQAPVEKLPTKDDLKMLNEQATAKSIAGTVISNAGNNIADKLFGGKNVLPITGTLGGWTADLIGESDARVIRRNLEVLGANASIETLQAMRRQSKTGGALGNVTERELAMLKASKGVLDQTYDTKDFTKAYLEYMNVMFKVVYGDTSELGQKYGVTAGQKAYDEWLSGIKSEYNLDDNMQRKGDVQTTDPQSPVIDYNELFK